MLVDPSGRTGAEPGLEITRGAILTLAFVQAVVTIETVRATLQKKTPNQTLDRDENELRETSIRNVIETHVSRSECRCTLDHRYTCTCQCRHSSRRHFCTGMRHIH